MGRSGLHGIAQGTLGIGDDKPSTNYGVRRTQTQDDKLLIQPRHQRIQAGLLVWIDFYNPLNLAILKRSVLGCTVQCLTGKLHCPKAKL